MLIYEKGTICFPCELLLAVNQLCSQCVHANDPKNHAVKGCASQCNDLNGLTVSFLPVLHQIFHQVCVNRVQTEYSTAHSSPMEHHNGALRSAIVAY